MTTESYDIGGILVAVIAFGGLGIFFCKSLWDCCRWTRRYVINYIRTRNYVLLSNAQSLPSINQTQPRNEAVSAPTTGPRRRKSPPQLENISPDNVNKDLRGVDDGNENVNSDTRVENATNLPLNIEEEGVVII